MKKTDAFWAPWISFLAKKMQQMQLQQMQLTM